MPVADFCKAPVITVTPDQNALDAVKLMRDKKVGSVVVTERGKPIGILTDRDILMRVTAEEKEASKTKVCDIMAPNPVVVPESMGVWELIETMREHGKRRFPVVAGDGKLVGIITLDDLIELLGLEMSGLGQAISSDLGYTALL